MLTGFQGVVVQLENLKLTAQTTVMDSIFLFGEQDRASFLQNMMQYLNSTYICLWSYLPQPSSCLLYLDGIYREVSNPQQPSSSSGSLAQRLFNAYCESVYFVDNGRIPGFAFKNNVSYMELKEHDFRRMASTEIQLQFYQEAGIKTAVFMGCSTGEIELGMASEPQVNLEMELRNWFQVDSSRQAAPPELIIPQPADQNQPPSSSSSSLRSLSVDDSTEYSPLLFSIPTTSFIPRQPNEALNIGSETLLDQTLRSSLPMPAPIVTSPHQQAFQITSQIPNVQFPTTESVDAAMTNAILAVLSSPSTSSSSPQNLPPVIHKPTAFRKYREALAVAPRMRKHNMLRRALSFFRNLNMRRRQELQIQGNRPSTAQLHHMISERRRREKLNESFEVLRSLLPPGSKKDKASVLSNTVEYLGLLRSQVSELVKRNQTLEAQVSTDQRKATEEVGGSSSLERINVELEQVSSSTSEERFMDLRVNVRGESSMLDLITRIMGFLKTQRNVSLLSLESNTRMVESTQLHGMTLRLKIEGDEFDESGFQEAVRRVVDDLPH